MAVGVKIGKFQIHSLNRILRIEREAFGRYAWKGELFREYASACADLFLVAKINRSIAGYSITCVRGNRAELDSIAVAVKFRQKGVARALLRFVVRKLRRVGIKSLALMVRRDNQAAIELYRSLGFARVRTVSRYYEDGASGWRMQVTLR
jgi:ribosomal-protein-alanine N-acetyltransferase